MNGLAPLTAVNKDVAHKNDVENTSLILKNTIYLLHIVKTQYNATET